MINYRELNKKDFISRGPWIKAVTNALFSDKEFLLITTLRKYCSSLQVPALSF